MRARTTLFVMLFTILVQLCTMGGNLANAALERTQSEQRTVQNIASNLARSCEHMLAVNDVAGLGRQVQALLGSESVLFAAVSDVRGQVVALEEREPGVWQESHRVGDSFHGVVAQTSVFEPLASGARRCIGSVQVGLQRSSFLQAVKLDAASRLAIMALVVILSVPMARRMVRVLTRRLDAVVVASERIARGSLDCEIRNDDDDEVGRLTRAFEQMRRSLKQRDQEMSTFNQRLQEQVAARTRDLETALDRAESASRAKSEFLANMSHELRTPIHIILSFADLGLTRAGSASVEKSLMYFDRIGQSGRRLLGLVNALLDLSELETGSQELTLEPNGIRRLLGQVADELKPLLASRNLRIQVTDDSDKELLIDRDRIRQVLHNVLGNAAKFSPAGGTISVGITDLGDACQVTVADEGVGIPEDELESIFGKFTQSSRTKTGAGGTGLGLSISRQILALHGGRIWARNRSPHGAEFLLVIPARPVVPVTPMGPPEPALLPSLEHKP